MAILSRLNFTGYIQKGSYEFYYEAHIMTCMAGEAVSCILGDRSEPEWDWAISKDRRDQFRAQLQVIELLGDVKLDIERLFGNYARRRSIMRIALSCTIASLTAGRYS